MSRKSLAEMRASGSVGLPRRSYVACLAAPLVVRLRELDIELAALPAPTEDAPKSRRRAVDADPRVALTEERAKLLVDMEDHLAEVIITAKPLDEWRAWKAEHRPRPDNPQDAEADLDFDALLVELPNHVVTVNDDPLGPGDWEWLCSVIAPAHLEGMAWEVAQMHEVGIQVPKQ